MSAFRKGDRVSLDLADVIIAVSRAESVIGIDYSSFSGKRTRCLGFQTGRRYKL
jgi:hypothetical protein